MATSSRRSHYPLRPTDFLLLVLFVFLPTVTLGKPQTDTPASPQSPTSNAQVLESPAPPPHDADQRTGTAIPSVSDTARVMDERGLAVNLNGGPESEELQWDIDKDAERFALPFGESPAFLVKLPEYKAPYTLAISSYPLRGFRKAIFVPTVTFFDSNFQPTADLPESTFKYSQMGFGRSHFEASVLIDDSRRADRYALVFTDGRQLGQVVRSSLGASLLIPNSIQRSYLGDVRLEVKASK